MDKILGLIVFDVSLSLMHRVHRGAYELSSNQTVVSENWFQVRIHSLDLSENLISQAKWIGYSERRPFQDLNILTAEVGVP